MVQVKNSFLDCLIWWCFVVVVVGVPLVFIPNIFLEYELPKAALFRTLTLLIWLFLGWKVLLGKGFEILKIKKLFWYFFFAFLGVVFLASIFSLSPYISFWGSYERQQGFLQFVHYILFFISAIVFFGGKERGKYTFERLMKWVCFGALIVSLIAIFQKFSVIRVFGTIGQPNFLANYLLICLPFLILNAVDGFSKRQKYFWISSVILVSLAMILTGGRAVMIGVFAGFIIFSLLSSNKKLLLVPALLFVLVLLLNVFGYLSFVSENVFLSRFLIEGEAFRSAEIRLTVWPAVVKQILAEPFLGYGLEMMSEGFLRFAPVELLGMGDFGNVVDRAHNEILDVAVSIGVFGLISYLLMFFYVLKLSFLNRKNLLAFAGLVSMVSLFVANMFSFSTTIHFVFWWLILAMLVTFCGKVSGKEKYFRLRAKAAVQLIGLFLLTGIVGFVIFSINVRPVLADYHYKKGIESVLRLDHFDASKHFEEALHLNPAQVSYAFMGAEHAFLVGEESFIDKGEWFLDHAKDRIGTNLFKVVFLEGRREFVKGNYDEALKYFERAYFISPTNPDVIVEWAKVLRDQGNYFEALEKFEEYLDLIPYWNEAFYIEEKTKQKKDRFKLFFIQNTSFLYTLEDIAELYKEVGDEEKSSYYKKFVDKIQEILSGKI